MVKIGRTSRSIGDRLYQLQQGNPQKLIVFVALDEDYEKGLHRHFSAYRLEGTEWFNLPSDPVEMVREALKTVVSWEAEVEARQKAKGPIKPVMVKPKKVKSGLIYLCTGHDRFCNCGRMGGCTF